MARIKRGVVSRRKHNKLLELAKGYRMTRSRLIGQAKDAVLHAGEYAFAGRKMKKRDFRSLWITRLNAALKGMGLKYNAFIHTLKQAEITLDRKTLSNLAANYPKSFEAFVKSTQK
jgi:large subunit ribosomal protein L20